MLRRYQTQALTGSSSECLKVKKSQKLVTDMTGPHKDDVLSKDISTFLNMIKTFKSAASICIIS